MPRGSRKTKGSSLSGYVMGCLAAFIEYGPAHESAVATAMQLEALAPELGGQGVAVK